MVKKVPTAIYFKKYFQEEAENCATSISLDICSAVTETCATKMSR